MFKKFDGDLDSLVQTDEDAFPFLLTEFMHQSDAGKLRMFKMFAVTGKYEQIESIAICLGMLELLNGGPEAFDKWLDESLAALT